MLTPHKSWWQSVQIHTFLTRDELSHKPQVFPAKDAFFRDLIIFHHRVETKEETMEKFVHIQTFIWCYEIPERIFFFQVHRTFQLQLLGSLVKHVEKIVQ